MSDTEGKSVFAKEVLRGMCYLFALIILAHGGKLGVVVGSEEGGCGALCVVSFRINKGKYELLSG